MRICGYELLEEIGRGAMATVFRARAPGGEEVALKVLAAEPHREAVVRFEREQRILLALREAPGLVPLIDRGGPPRFAHSFIVMPFVAGGTLRDRLRDGPLAVTDTIALGVSLASALRVAHERGVIHRDMKPENVLFTRKGRTAAEWGRPLLADFGLAKELLDDPDADQGFTTTGDIVGTMSYMAPEQLRDAKRSGPAADLFGLGAILHECLSGVAPFEAPTIEEIARRILRGERSPLGRNDVPRELARALRAALAVDPRDRPVSAAAFANTLREVSMRPGAAVSSRWRALAALLAGSS